MDLLPYFVDKEEAIDYYHAQTSKNDALKAYIVGFLSKEKMSNKNIRSALGIEQVYTVTHLKRAGTRLSEDELTLWFNNADKISLGHVRAIAKLDQVKRERLLRDLLVKRIPVQHYESLARGEKEERDVDIKRLEEQMSSQLGREIHISYSSRRKTGTISLGYYQLEDLDRIITKLGFRADSDF